MYAEGARLVTPDHARMHMCECGTTPSCSSSVNRGGATGLGNTAAFTTDHAQPYQFLARSWWLRRAYVRAVASRSWPGYQESSFFLLSVNFSYISFLNTVPGKLEETSSRVKLLKIQEEKQKEVGL